MTVKVNGKHVLDSPFSIEVKLFQLSPVLSFGKEGSSVGMFNGPWGGGSECQGRDSCN